MGNFQDMHIHSTCSDGSKTVPELLQELKERQVTPFSITDHDSLESVLELKRLNPEMEWYPGIEVSTIYHNHKIHLLGYGFEEDNSEIKKLLAWIQNQRRIRFYEMVKKAEVEFQVSIPTTYFEELEKKGTILIRPHLMRYLVQIGCGENSDVMDRIEEHCNSKISYRADLKWAIECLKEAKALLVIAHPKEIEKESQIAFESLIGELVKLGIDGIEVYHSIHTDRDIKKYHALACDYHLLESGGSDYHGPDRKGRELGIVTKSGAKVKDLSLVESLRCRK